MYNFAIEGSQGYYPQKHDPDQYISELIHDFRNELDDLHRKIRENGRPLDLYNNGYYIEEYRYDPAGNVIMEGNAWGTIDFEYNAANQLIQAGNRTYNYDANGNLIKEGYKGDYVEYNYNYENRLIKASNLSENDKLFGGEHPFTGTIAYTYDALGRKTGKELTPANGNRVMINGYYYDGGGVNVLAEYEDEIWDINKYRQGKKNTTGQIPGGQVKYFNEYYYGRELIAFNNMNNPNPWKNIRADINFYHKDVLGSITAITGKNGNMVEKYSYGAYGNPYEGRFLNMQKNNPYGFTGQRFEPELRMYTFAYRIYNPMSMRWMTPDPVRDGINWYQYVSGDPVNLWDPLGLCGEDFDESGHTEFNIVSGIRMFYPDGSSKSIKIDIALTYIHDFPKGEEYALELYKQQNTLDKIRAAAFFTVGIFTQDPFSTTIGAIDFITTIASDTPRYDAGDIIIDTSEMDISFSGKAISRPAVKEERHIEIISRFGIVKYEKQYSNQHY